MSLQVPPLTQGFDSHSLLLTSQLAPLQPGSQSHLYLQRDQAAQGRPRWAFPPPPAPGRMAWRRPSPLTLSPLRWGTSTHQPWLCVPEPSAYPLCAKWGHRAPARLNGPVQTERCGHVMGVRKLRFPLCTLKLPTPNEGEGPGPTSPPHVKRQSPALGPPAFLTDHPHTGAPHPRSLAIG